MRWAILDDGVNLELPAIVQNLEIDRHGMVKKRISKSTSDHATICFKIIQKYAGTLFDVVSIKILNDDTRRGNKDALIAAFRWCMENEIRLIHMSIGTTDPRDGEEIRTLIGELTARGIIIVAANSNKGVQTYPAYENRVIGVECDATLRDDQFVYTPNALNGMMFRASSRHRIAGGPVPITSFANSFAAPLITAQLLKLAERERCFSYARAVEWLRENAVRTDERVLFSLPHNAEKAVVIALLGLDRVLTRQLMTEWKTLFRKDGYVCCMSAPAEWLIPEAEVIPSRITQGRYLDWAARFFSCEVILAALTEEELDGTETEIDLLVTCNASRIPPAYHEAVIYTESDGTVRSSDELYQELISILTEEETPMKLIEDRSMPTIWAEP